MAAPYGLDQAPEFCRLGAVNLAAYFGRREISPVEVAEAAIARGEAVNPELNAFTFFDRAGALEAALASERRWRDGVPLSPVDGVPTTLKDIVWVAGWEITSGSLSTPANRCPEDAPAVARLRAAGAVFIGATNTPEFGWKALTDSPRFGITRNPLDPDLTPGGSSGGAAVAAAVGAGALHLGTDGGGSIRIPAAFTGIAGHKPTFGRVAAYPASAFGTLAHVGPMARDLDDVRLMLDAMAGRDLRDWWQGAAEHAPLVPPPLRLHGLRVGFWSRPPGGDVDPEIAAATAAAVDRLGALGARVERVDFDDPELLAAFNVLWFSGAAARVAQAGVKPDQLDPGLAEVGAEGAALSALDYLNATRQRATFGAHLDLLFARLDVIVSPATAVLPFGAGRETPEGSHYRRWTEWAGFSFPVNLGQHPASVFPVAKSTSGLPIALQVIAARGADAAALQAAQSIQAALAEP